MTTIRLKRGTGKPDGLEYGEVAVDTGAQVLYAGTADGSVVELSGGDIDWEQIDLPDWIIEIGPDGTINLSELEKQVNANAEEIGKLQTDVNQLWNAIQDVSSLATAAWNKANENADKIADNKTEIDAIKNEINAIESGLIFGGVYSPVSNAVTNVDKYALDRGFTEGGVLTTNTTAAQQGIYFIVTESGECVTGESVKAGDWLIANAQSWTVVSYGFETISIDQVGGLQDELDSLHEFDTELEARVTALETEIDGGTYTGTPPNFRS
ncbi:MAG: hypothetical protein VXA09_07880 [Burkholderiaceae bacterium]